MSTVYENIAELVTNDATLGDGSPLGIVTDAAIVVDNGVVAWVGPRAQAPAADDRSDLAGAAVIPGFVDSHAHLVFAGDRSAEFAARMAGEPYDGGGIATTVAATRSATDAQLAANVARLADELRRGGVTTFETKSGYGLSTSDEARSLRVAGEFTSETTFLGAHVVPREYRDNREDYVRLVAGDMLAACRPHARWVDVFCEHNAFDVDETRVILEAGIAAGLTRGCTPGSSDPAMASAWASSWARRRSTTAHTPPTPTSKRSPRRRQTPSPRCFRERSSPRAQSIPTPAGSSMPVSPSHWPPTATRVAPTPPAWRSASPSRCAT